MDKKDNANGIMARDIMAVRNVETRSMLLLLLLLILLYSVHIASAGPPSPPPPPPPPPPDSLTISNTVADQGQGELLTFEVSGGTLPYTYNFLVTNSLNGNIIFSNVISNTLAANSVFFSLPINQNDIGTENVIGDAFSSGPGPGPQPMNYNTNTITVYPALAHNAIIESNAIADQGQHESIEYSWIGGNAPYTVNIMVTNALYGNVIANIITVTSSTSNVLAFTIPDNSLGIGTANVVANVIDSATTNAFLLTANTLRLYPALAAVSNTVSNTVADQGQGELLTFTISGGAPPYTYNFLVTNSVNGNVIFSNVISNTLAANSVFFALSTSNANDIGALDVSGNVVDSASNAVSNTIFSNTITVYPKPSVALSQSLTSFSISAGQKDVLSAKVSNGKGPFTINFELSSGTVANTVAGVTSGNTATYTYYTSTPGAYTFNTVVSDTGTSLVFTFNSGSVSVKAVPGHGLVGSGGTGGAIATPPSPAALPATTITQPTTTVVTTAPASALSPAAAGTPTSGASAAHSTSGAAASPIKQAASRFKVSKAELAVLTGAVGAGVVAALLYNKFISTPRKHRGHRGY